MKMYESKRLVISYQIYIDGLIRKRGNPVANVLEYALFP